MAEYQALMRLAPAVKEQIVPLIRIPAVEFDFDRRQPKKTVHEHVVPFIERFHRKWGERPAWISLSEEIAAGRMDSGQHVLSYIFEGLRHYNASAIPAIPLRTDAGINTATHRIINLDQHGVGFMIQLEDLMAGNTADRMDELAKVIAVSKPEVDLIIDLRAPNFEPYFIFATALMSAIQKLGDLSDFRNLIILSTAIPESFRDVARGTDHLPRHDWLFFQTLLNIWPTGMPHPIYGDYTTVHPNFVARDLRLVKPAGKVIYTTSKTWGTRKGSAFRGNEAQMHDHCREIVNDAVFQFQGAAFSFGDDYIAKCATNQKGSSNLTRWKDVSINHHITMVTNDLAKLAASSSRF
ncbi:MAG: beta family protein [Rhodobacteraceae bacterium]|nr:beta family protein [Paracoccaceae bacterium]